MADNRSTGWKIPLMFCAGVIVLVAGVSALLPRAGQQDCPAFSTSLLEKAKALRIDLQKDAAGRMWQNEITAASSGFAPYAEKDAKLTAVIHSALAATARYDAACAASVLVNNTTTRDALRFAIAEHAADACATLPWAVMAAYGIDDVQVYMRAYTNIEDTFALCQRDVQTH